MDDKLLQKCMLRDVHSCSERSNARMVPKKSRFCYFGRNHSLEGALVRIGLIKECRKQEIKEPNVDIQSFSTGI